jgi:hypothetical protein
VIRTYLDPPLVAAPGGEHASPSRAQGPLRADLAGFALAALVLVALPVASALLRAARPAAPEAAVRTTPRAPWVPALLDVRSSWQPVFAGADRQERLAFSDGGGNTVEAFAVTYRAQRQGAKLHDKDNSLLGPQLDVLAAAPAPHGFRAQEVAEHTPAHAAYLIWSRYESAGRGFPNPLLAQLWYGINATVSNPSASLVALRAMCRPDCEAARRSLLEFCASDALRCATRISPRTRSATCANDSAGATRAPRSQAMDTLMPSFAIHRSLTVSGEPRPPKRSSRAASRASSSAPISPERVPRVGAVI